LQIITQRNLKKMLNMFGFDKVVENYSEALDGLEDNLTVIAGGFGLCGISEGCINQIKKM